MIAGPVQFWMLPLNAAAYCVPELEIFLSDALQCRLKQQNIGKLVE